MKSKILVFLIIGMLFIPTNVNATTCESKITELKKLKNNIKLKYTHLSKAEAQKNYQVDSDNLYTISVYNLPKDIVIESSVEDKSAENTTAEELINIEPFTRGYGGNTITIGVYTRDDYECFANLGVIDIKLPWYNFFSEKEECKGNEDFKYCKKYLNVRISETQFNSELERYLKNKPSEEKIEEKKSFLSNIKDNIVLISLGGVILITIITFILIKVKRKKRRKF